MLSVTSQKWVSKQVSNFLPLQNNTRLWSPENTYIPTILKEEEKALKHSSVNCEQSAQTFAALSLSLWKYRSMRKVNETVDFTPIDRLLPDIDLRGVEEF